MSSAIEVRELGHDEHADWDRLVAGSPHGSTYALSAYLDALCRATGGTFRVLAAIRDGAILGGVTLYGESSRFGTRVETRPLLYYNGFVLRAGNGKYPSLRTALEVSTLAALEQALARLRLARLSLKSRDALHDARVFLDQGWQARPTYTYVVPLDDLGALWERMEKNLRRLVRRGEREQLAFTDDDDFPSFYRMHAQTHRRKGAPLYLPEPAFATWFHSLRALGLCRLYQARLPDGRSIAAQLVLLGPHPVSHTVAAAADAEHLELGANAFLRWRAFEDLAGRGAVANDLTDASLNPVTHFKSQLGGELRVNLVLSRPEPLAPRLARGAARLALGANSRLVRAVRGSRP